MANTTSIVTTFTKATNKEKTPNEADAVLKVNILDFYEKHYEDILPVIMDKIRRDKRKEVHARLDFREDSKKSQRVREGSQNSSAGTLPARYRNLSERPKMRDRLRYNDGNDRSHSRGRPRKRDSSPSRDRPRSRDRLRDIEESYGNTCSSYRTEARHRYHSRDRDRSYSMKKERKENPNYLAKEDPEDHVKIFQAAAQLERWAMRTWCHMFNYTLIGTARVWFDELPPESIDGYKDLKVSFLAYFMQQKKYVKDLVEIHNFKQRDGETIEDFMERFKVETGRLKGAPECMRISGFMHGVNNPELTKRLNEHVPKTMEEMMTATTAFIQGETVVASKKKGHASWKPQDQPKRHVSEQRSDFRGQPREGRGSNREITFPPLATSRGTKGPLVIEAEFGGHMIHYMYVDGGSSMESFDMTGVPRSVAEHRLNNREGYLPVRQKKRGQALERARAIQVEVQKVVEVRIMREVYYHDCLSNPVMVKKHDGSWRMCVDFTDLNKACPQDCYPLPEIDWKVESLCGYPFKAVEGMFLGYMISPEGKKPCPPRQNKSRAATPVPTDNQRGPEPQWKGHGLDASLFHKPHTAGPKAKLYPNGKASSSIGFRRQESVVLGEHNITYWPRTYVKGQILADFLVEKSDEASPDMLVVRTLQEPWILFTDGSSCVDGSGAGLILTSPEGTKFTYVLRFQFTPSNNEVEYEALIAGLRIVTQMGVRNVHVSIDSKLVVNQVLGTYVAKEENMIKYLEKAKSLVLVEVLKEKSIQEKEVATAVEEDEPTWTTPIMEYLKDGTLPDDRKETCKLRIKAKQYELLEGVLYRQSFLKPWLSQVKKFVWDNIVCRFSLSREIVSDNVVDTVHNDEELRLNLDLLKVRRERVAIHEAKAKLKMTKYYNARVRGVTFRPGDFVYRSNDASHAVDGGNLGLKWEGPYKVTKALGDGAYRLRSMDGTVLSRTWNIANLKKCYL
nr:reverse transcriptase domain-containing protein [Tanacetum cinerariifolium]